MTKMTNLMTTKTSGTILTGASVCADLPGGENVVGASCPAANDTLQCWPRTRAGSLATLPCFDELFGIKYDTSQNASKMCWPNGTWEGYTNYTMCKEMNMTNPKSSVGVETITHLYLVGYGVSLISLIIAVAIYLYYRELRCLRNIIHTNLMVTYILSDFLWILMTVSQVNLERNIPMCIAFYSMYHYFQLTNFFWMFVEGLYLYLLVVKTFSGDNIKLKVCLMIGWGIPFVVVVIWGLVKSLTSAMEATGVEEEALSQHCPWMIPHPYDWLYQVPAIFVLCVNVIFLLMIMWVLITKLRSANNAETQQYRKAAKALLVLIPLLGITYILMLMGPTEGQIAYVFNFARATMLSFQGLSVAIFYCFLNNEVRNALRHHLERWTTERSLGTGQRYYAHWAPRSRTESIRLYCRPATAADAVAPAAAGNNVGPAANGGSCNNHAKEALVSEATATTTSVLSANSASHHGANNFFFAGFKKNYI